MGSVLETLRGVREGEETRNSAVMLRASVPDAQLWHSNIRTMKSLGHHLLAVKSYI